MPITAELLHTLQRAFKPLACTCQRETDASLTIDIYDPQGQQQLLSERGIPAHRYATSHALLQLIIELRQRVLNQCRRLRLTHSGPPRRLQ